MALKVYRARTMQEALAEVKRDLGADAVILNTRSYKSRGLLGLGAKPVVEITATADENPATRPPAARPARPRQQPSPAAPASRPLRSAEAAKAYASKSATTPPALPIDDDPIELLDVPPRQPVSPRPGIEAKPPAKSLAEPPPEPSQPVRMRVASSSSKPATPATDVEHELRSIKTMMSRLVRSAATERIGVGSMSDPLFEHYLAMQEHAVAADLADTIAGRVRDELSVAELDDAEIVRETVLRQIAGRIPVAHEPASRSRPIDDRPFTLALIGPTGVGKTTTLAKLAARAKLRHGRSVGLITTDTYRIAAVEQLRTYAEIIGLPLKVVADPSQMAEALESMASLDEVLIDTAGRSQHDAERLTELRSYLDQADPHETHLVLSSVASDAVLTRAAERFGTLGPNRLVMTKLDEAVELGTLLGLLERIKAPLSFVTTGQEVPDDIEPASAERLARQILLGTGSAATTAHRPEGAHA